MSNVLADAPTSLYRYYDADGELLYIGVTARGASRAHEHNRSKAWWPLVASSTVEHFVNRDLALAEERRLIHYWRPPHNTQHRPAGPPRRLRTLRESAPTDAYRTIMGRTSRAAHVKDIDPDLVTQDLPEWRRLVHEARWASVQRNETIQQFRDRLKDSRPA